MTVILETSNFMVKIIYVFTEDIITIDKYRYITHRLHLHTATVLSVVNHLLQM